jgi:hypothetical protein
MTRLSSTVEKSLVWSIHLLNTTPSKSLAFVDFHEFNQSNAKYRNTQKEQTNFYNKHLTNSFVATLSIFVWIIFNPLLL